MNEPDPDARPETKRKWCDTHEMWHVKNAMGLFVCPFCERRQRIEAERPLFRSAAFHVGAVGSIVVALYALGTPFTGLLVATLCFIGAVLMGYVDAPEAWRGPHQ